MALAQAQDRPRVLFVDDEQRVLNSMRIMFRREFDLYLASRGAEALKIVRDHDIDVIVADHRMPEMTGVEVLTQVRRQSPRTVRILLTGYADLDAVEGSINDGEVFRFLTKPCPPAQLKETVTHAAALARATAAPGAADDGAIEDDSVLDIILEGDTVESSAPRRVTAPPAPQPQKPARSPRPAAASGLATASPAAPARPAAATAAQHKPVRPAAPARPAAPEPDDDASFDPTATATIERPPVLEPAPAKPARTRPRGLGIIVFSNDPDVRDTVQRAVRGRVPVFGATNIVQVVKVLTEHQPGVLLTDVTDDKATIQSMTARLKQHLPELVTIAVSQHRDVLDMVWLINHGQIFRFLRKPLSPGRCAICLQAALKHHRTLLKNPELVRRHEVDDSDGNAGVVEGMLSKLKLVRRLWASA